MEMYLILDENKEVMRKVPTKAEAEYLLKTYTDWSYKYVANPKKEIDLSQFEEAPF